MAETDLADLREQCIKSLFLCSDNVSKYLDGDEKEAAFNQLKAYVEDYCLLEYQEKVASNALERAKGDTDASNIGTLDERFASNLDSMTNEQGNNSNHKYIKEMKRRIERGMQVRNNLEDSDFALTESSNRLIDPITKKPIEDPVKNSVCGHIYERESIMNLIRIKPKSKCPVAGCGNRGPVMPQHLISDEELQFQMQQPVAHSTMMQASMMELDDSD